MLFAFIMLGWVYVASTPLDTAAVLLVPLLAAVVRGSYLDRPLFPLVYAFPLIAAVIVFFYMAEGTEGTIAAALMQAGKIAVSSYLLLHLIPGFIAVGPRLWIAGRGIYLVTRTLALVGHMYGDLRHILVWRLRWDSSASRLDKVVMMGGAIHTGFSELLRYSEEVKRLYDARRGRETALHWVRPSRRRSAIIFGDFALLVGVVVLAALELREVVPARWYLGLQNVVPTLGG